MPDDQDQSSEQAPQHVLRAAIIPIRLDMTEADKQIEKLEERIASLSDKAKIVTPDKSASDPAPLPKPNQPTTQTPQPAASISATDLKILEAVSLLHDVLEEIRNIKQTIEDMKQ